MDQLNTGQEQKRRKSDFRIVAVAHAHNSIHHSMAGPDQRGLRTKLTVIKMKLVRKGVIIPSKRPAALVPGLLVTSVVSVTPMLHVQITILRTGEAGSCWGFVGLPKYWRGIETNVLFLGATRLSSIKCEIACESRVGFGRFFPGEKYRFDFVNEWKMLSDRYVDFVKKCSFFC